MPCITDLSNIPLKSEVDESSEEPGIHGQVADSENVDKTSEESQIVTDAEPVDTSEPGKEIEEVKDEEVLQADAKDEGLLQKDHLRSSVKEETVADVSNEDYEQLRLRNIREKEKMLSEIFKGVNVDDLKESLTRSPKRKRVNVERKTPKVLVLPRKHLPRRSASKAASERLASECFVDDDEIADLSDEEEETMVNGRKRKLVVAFRPRARNGTLPSEPRVILSAEEITEAHLSKVADIVTEKVYTQSGTTCHQCRQKTNDMKTICRSEKCPGVRGYFCGPCLRNRYGEDARAALKDPNWKCPPCRDICNCSICRNRAGARATGILTPIAKRCGYASVKDYLNDHDKYVIKYEDD